MYRLSLTHPKRAKSDNKMKGKTEDCSSSEDEKDPTLAQLVKRNVSGHISRHDLSDSSLSSDSGSIKLKLKRKSDGVEFSDSMSESGSVTQQVTGIIDKLGSPAKKAISQGSSVSSSNLSLGGLKYSPLRTPAACRLDSTVFDDKARGSMKRNETNSSSEESDSESDINESHVQKKTQKIVHSIFGKEENLKFHCPTGFKETVFNKQSLWHEGLEGKELWLIKTPLDFDPSMLKDQDPHSISTVLKKETTQDGERMVWKTRKMYDNGERVNDCSVVVPSKASKRLKYCGEFSGELQIYKNYETKPYIVPASTKVPPKIPEGLRVRYVPFGSGRDSGDTIKENGDLVELSTLIDGVSKKKKKKRKSYLETTVATGLHESKPDIEERTVNNHSLSAPSKKSKKMKKTCEQEQPPELSETAGLNPDCNETASMDKPSIESSKKKKKKQKKSSLREELAVDCDLKQEPHEDISMQEVSVQSSKKKKRKKHKDTIEKELKTEHFDLNLNNNNSLSVIDDCFDESESSKIKKIKKKKV